MTVCVHRYSIDPRSVEALEECTADLNELTDKWIESSQEALETLQRMRTGPGSGAAGGVDRHINVVVSSGQLVPTLGKLILYQLAPLVPVDRVYSSARHGKKFIFEQIAARFGKEAKYCFMCSDEADHSAAKEVVPSAEVVQVCVLRSEFQHLSTVKCHCCSDI